MFDRNQPGFCVGASKSTWFKNADRNLLDFSHGIKICLVFVWAIELDLVVELVSKLAFRAESRSCLFFGVRADNGFVFMYGSEKVGFRAGIAINYFFLCGPKVTGSQCGDRLTCFMCRLSKLTWFWYVSWKSLAFSLSIELDFVFLWVVEIELISMWRSNSIPFRCSDWSYFICVGLENYLVVLSRSK